MHTYGDLKSMGLQSDAFCFRGPVDAITGSLAQFAALIFVSMYISTETFHAKPHHPDSADICEKQLAVVILLHEYSPSQQEHLELS